jgi:hypothetical protein
MPKLSPEKRLNKVYESIREMGTLWTTFAFIDFAFQLSSAYPHKWYLRQLLMPLIFIIGGQLLTLYAIGQQTDESEASNHPIPRVVEPLD